MTLYYNALEKRMNNWPLPYAVPVFWPKLKSGEPKETTQTYPHYNLSQMPNKPVKSPKEEVYDKVSRPAGIKVSTEAIIECTNTPVNISALTEGVIAKIPVLLAELTVKLNVASVIDLPERAFEIKQIQKRLKVTQCILLHNTNILFIKGLVRKDIEYTTGIIKNIERHHCTVDVPFKCTTAVTFNALEPAPIASDKSSEYKFSKKTDILEMGFSDQDEILSSDISELNQISTAFYNELPFCELSSSKIVDFHEFLNKVPANRSFYEETFFNEIEEKTVINLTIKILQYRQVVIPPTS